VQFYLAFLLLIAVVQGMCSILDERWAMVRSVFTGLIFGALAFYSIHRWFALGKNDFGGRWYMFFSGVILYWTLRGRVDRRLTMLYLVILSGLSIWFLELRSGMIVLTTAAIFGVAMIGGLQTWLSARWVQYLGRISYSFYLVHMPIGVAAIALVMKFSSGSTAMVFVAFASAVVVAILAADLLYRFVESPAIALSKRLKHTKPKPAVEINAPIALPSATQESMCAL
jgi:peptidoglycan/LPS O-acetylase OafA/YrhL